MNVVYISPFEFHYIILGQFLTYLLLYHIINTNQNKYLVLYVT